MINDGKNRAYTGVGKCYYALIKEDGNYDEVKDLAKLIEQGIKPNTNTSEAHASDSIYLQDISYGSTDFNMTVYSLIGTAYCEIYGHQLNSTKDGYSIGDDYINSIALMLERNYTTESGKGTEYVCLYEGKLEEPEITGKTKEENGVEYQTIQISGKFKINEKAKKSQAVWTKKPSGWGKTVPMPDASTEADTEPTI